MLNEKNTNIERIIAKIDNDFNPDNSDWIPRVGAWCIDAMSQIDCLPTELKRKQLTVKNRIAYISEDIPDNSKIFDCNGCRIYNAKHKGNCGCGDGQSNISTGCQTSVELSNTMSHEHHNVVEDVSIATQIIGVYPQKHTVTTIKKGNFERNFVFVNKHQIELNFDTDCITIEYNGVVTECSEEYGCELPVVPNNGLLIEAIVYYCMYKMLCRGYKHPVFNLAASQYGTNPYYIWNQLKEQAKRSVIINGFNDDVSKLWRDAMFIHMFDPRR